MPGSAAKSVVLKPCARGQAASVEVVGAARANPADAALEPAAADRTPHDET